MLVSCYRAKVKRPRVPGFAECGPDKTAGDCIVCAGALSYLALGVRQSLTVRDIIRVVDYG